MKTSSNLTIESVPPPHTPNKNNRAAPIRSPNGGMVSIEVKMPEIDSLRMTGVAGVDRQFARSAVLRSVSGS